MGLVQLLDAYLARIDGGDGIGPIALPLIMFLILLILHFLWKKYTKITMVLQKLPAL